MQTDTETETEAETKIKTEMCKGSVRDRGKGRQTNKQTER